MPMPEMVPVVSSNIASVGYDFSESALYVGYRSGGIYKYDGVPEVHYEGALAAESVGKYISQNILGPDPKGNPLYPYHRI